MARLTNSWPTARRTHTLIHCRPSPPVGLTMRHLLYVSMCLFVNVASGEFVSPSSVDEVRERISALPQDEIGRAHV